MQQINKAKSKMANGQGAHQKKDTPWCWLLSKQKPPVIGVTNELNNQTLRSTPAILDPKFGKANVKPANKKR